MNAPFAAESWNQLVREVSKARAIAGMGCMVDQTPRGCIVSGDGGGEFRHPWQVRASWRIDPAISPQGGVWTATIQPGFVSGRDVTIAPESSFSAEREHAPLTAEEPPMLVFSSFRDPAAPGGFTASLSGDIRVKAGEGYPPFFEQLGVIPAHKGGDGFGAMDHEFDENRTRQIRAADIVLVTPRIATRQHVDVRNPLTDSQTVEISTVFMNDRLRSAPSRHWIFATSKWSSPAEPTALDRLMGTAVEPQTDELKLATLYLVSPPDFPADQPPDGSWTPYPQHYVFWNLNHASRAQMPGAPPRPIELRTGLALGVADALFSALLSPVNDAFAQIHAYFNGADFKGIYWSV